MQMVRIVFNREKCEYYVTGGSGSDVYGHYMDYAAWLMDLDLYLGLEGIEKEKV